MVVSRILDTRGHVAQNSLTIPCGYRLRLWMPLSFVLDSVE